MHFLSNESLKVIIPPGTYDDRRMTWSSLASNSKSSAIMDIKIINTNQFVKNADRYMNE